MCGQVVEEGIRARRYIQRPPSGCGDAQRHLPLDVRLVAIGNKVLIISATQYLCSLCKDSHTLLTFQAVGGPADVNRLQKTLIERLKELGEKLGQSVTAAGYSDNCGCWLSEYKSRQQGIQPSKLFSADGEIYGHTVCT